MNEQDRQELKEYIFTAVQSGKRETSDLVDSFIHKMEPAIATNIEKYVNGHIREMKTHLVRQDEKLEEIHIEQIRVAEELKKVQPIIESRITILNVGRFVIWLGAISGAMATIIWIIEKVIQK